jgi:hypothetical protein
MSANNQLLIEKYHLGWKVSEIDVESGDEVKISKKLHKTLEQAVREANKYLENNVVEYGLRIEL